MKTKIMTVAELADVLKMDKLSVNGFLAVAEALGSVKKVGTRKVEGARGKPSNLFEIPESVTVALITVADEAPVAPVAVEAVAETVG